MDGRESGKQPGQDCHVFARIPFLGFQGEIKKARKVKTKINAGTCIVNGEAPADSYQKVVHEDVR